MASSAASAVEQVRTLPAVPLSTAARALGIGTSTASRHVTNGTFPVPFIRMGARVIVPTPALRELLQLAAAPSATEAVSA